MPSAALLGAADNATKDAADDVEMNCDVCVDDNSKLRALTVSICHICCNPVTNTDDLLECFGKCKQQVHTSCLNIPKNEIDVLQKNKNAVYVCDVCLALHDYDDRAKIDETLNEVASNLKKLHCLFDFVEKFETKVKKIVREECGKVFATKPKGDTSESATSGRVLRSAKKRKLAEHSGMAVVENNNEVLEMVNETPKSSVVSSFAEVVKLDKRGVQSNASRVAEKVVRNSKPNPKLVIRSVNKMHAAGIQSILKEKVDRKCLDIKDVKTRQDGSVVVELLNERSANELKERVVSCMGDLYEAERSEPPKPTVKMLGISEEMSEIQLRETLVQDNPFLCDMSHFKLRKCYAATKNANCKYNAIFEVDAVTYHKIMLKGKLLCNWDSCRAIDGLDVLRCFKCCGFNHKSSDCKESTETCPRCAGVHSVKQCVSTVLKCANCEKLKNSDSDSTDHAAWSETCPVYQTMKNKKKKTIDYSV